jgi:polysaccharide deacetylase 2 family uncharacterized protein YibQ
MPPRRESSFRTVAVLMLLPIGGLLLFLAFQYVREQVATLGSRRVDAASAVLLPSPNARKAATSAVKIAPQPRREPAASVPPRRSSGRADIVVILDDVGFDHQPLATAMQIDPNVNFAVLPNAARAQQFARELNARGFELLCHLPMEPENPRQSPGADAVRTAMSDTEIAAVTRANVAAVPFARGVNNHMGSRATSDRRVMTSVLSSLPKGLYFIDSRTTGASVAGEVARSMKIRTASRSIFLDDVQKEDAIRVQLAALVAAAETHGVAIGIGHMYPETVRVLAAEAPSLRGRGIRFLRASEVVN